MASVKRVSRTIIPIGLALRNNYKGVRESPTHANPFLISGAARKKKGCDFSAAATACEESAICHQSLGHDNALSLAADCDSSDLLSYQHQESAGVDHDNVANKRGRAHTWNQLGLLWDGSLITITKSRIVQNTARLFDLTRFLGSGAC